MEFFNDLWVPGIPILEKIVRSILVYFFLLIALRLGGKRELGQMNGFDMVVLLLLSNAVQNAIIGNDNSVLGGWIGATTLIVSNWLVVRFAYRYPKIQTLVEGEPTVLVWNGQIIPENLAKEVVLESELKTSLRRQGFENLSEIKAAILETSGMLSVERQPATTDEEYQQELRDRIDRLEATLNQIAQHLQIESK